MLLYVASRDICEELLRHIRRCLLQTERGRGGGGIKKEGDIFFIKSAKVILSFFFR